MKQTITVLCVLVAALLAASGFIVAANIDLSSIAAQKERELLRLRSELAGSEKKLEECAKESKITAETLRKTTEERDALSVQLNEAVLSSQESNDAVAQQVLRNEQQARELEALSAEYEDMSEACAALEQEIAALEEAAGQAALSHEAQLEKDAQRIMELEKALEEALAQTISPAQTPVVRLPVPPAV